MNDRKISNQDEGILKKVSMLGDPAVGKTSLVNRYVFRIFGDEYISTIGTKVVKKKLTYEDRKINLIIWDIAGETSFEHIRKAYFRGAEAGLVIADITRSETLDTLEGWISSFHEVTANAPVLILLNKSDLKSDYAFDVDDVDDLKNEFGTSCFLTSAKTGENVEEAFIKITELLLSKTKEGYDG